MLAGKRSTGKSLATAVLFFLGGIAAVPAEHDSRITSLQSLPPSTSVPVEVAYEMKAGSIKVGSRFVARTAQRIPVAIDRYLPQRVQVVGEVVTSEKGDAAAGHPSILTLRFSELSWKGQSVPFNAKILAVANFVQVMDAAVIATGATDVVTRIRRTGRPSR